VQQDGAVQFCQEAFGGARIIGDDAIGVPGTVVADMSQGGVQIFNHPDSHDGVQVLRTPVVVARRSDGSAVAWGTPSITNVPSLPAGMSYVAIAAGEYHALARRSDGSLVAWGDNTWGQSDVPPPSAGSSYVEVAGGSDFTVGLRERGIADDKLDARLDGVAPEEYYRSVFQTREYTLREWSRFFEILDYKERWISNFQDLVVMR